ncbi:MAG: cation transporter [Stomatobaculum sp.]
MKKKFKCEIDCANCAAKVEEAIRRVDGVLDARVNFITQKFTLEAEEAVFEAVLTRAIQAGKRAEAEFEVEV